MPLPPFRAPMASLLLNPEPSITHPSQHPEPWPVPLPPFRAPKAPLLPRAEHFTCLLHNLTHDP